MCIERTLGHRTHGLNLERAVLSSGTPVDMLHIDYPRRPRLRVPWTLRASVAAYRWLRAARPYGATFFHTQVTALLAPLAVRGRPYVVSVDATPVQMDAIGAAYGHRRGAPPIEAVKRTWYSTVVGEAAATVSWSHWAGRSLVQDYGADPASLLVAHPGAAPAFVALERRQHARRPGILFAGGDFERKGGSTLLRAFEGLEDRAELVLLTGARLAPRPGVRVVNDATPGSPALLQAFAEADVFCLPTLADCTPVALAEAMAAGLPVITTRIASNPEWVPEGAGLLVPPSEAGALRDALERLVDNASERARMGAAAREHAREHMDAQRNAGRILQLLGSVAA